MPFIQTQHLDGTAPTPLSLEEQQGELMTRMQRNRDLSLTRPELHELANATSPQPSHDTRHRCHA